MMQMTMEIPSWMIQAPPPSVDPIDEGKSLTQIKKELQEKRFEIAFPTLMDKVAAGSHLSVALAEYHADLDEGQFHRWLRKDPSRLGIYNEAKEIRAEVWSGQLLRRASGEDGLNDVARDKLFCDKLQWVMAADNRRHYGNHTTIETHQSINISAVLEQANARVPQLGRIIDHDPLED